MRIMLLGKNGQLGWELQRSLMTLGDVVALDLPEIDLSQPESIRGIIRQLQPLLIVNATAYTAVDRAEEEPDAAMAVNGLAPRVMAEEARDLGAGLIHYSTDYVFDGTKSTPYTEEDHPSPINVYGRTKLEGESGIQSVGGAFLILRTSWLYALRGENFIRKVLRWSRTQKTMRVVDDQIGSPTWARLLAEATAQAIAQGIRDVPGFLSEAKGVYHLAGSGSASRYAWAQAILEMDPLQDEQVVQDLLPARSDEFQTRARRPSCTSLDSSRFSTRFCICMPSWRESLAMAFEKM